MRTVFLASGITLSGMLFMRLGNMAAGCIAASLALILFARGWYELVCMERIRGFKNKPEYYTNFIVNFDLFFPAAAVVLLVIKNM